MSRLVQQFFGLLARKRLRLGVPVKLKGDVKISFRGQGEARFRVQHTRDHHGKPDEFGWADVTAIHNAAIDRERAIDRKEHVVRGMFVDWINGNRDVAYRHYSAAWLRVIPFDDDAASYRQCSRYSVRLRPV